MAVAEGKMIKAKKVKLGPTPTQIARIESHIGGARFCYNAMLAHAKEEYAREGKGNVSHFGLRKWWDDNKREIAPWWAENSSECYNFAAIHLADAYKRFFRKEAGYPKFKKKGHYGSYTVSAPRQTSIGIADPYGIKVPKIGRIHTFEKLDFTGNVKYLTISKDALGYWCSFCLEVDKPEIAERKVATVGIDLGVKNLATLSNGEFYPNLQFERSRARKRRRLAKDLSRKKKGSGHWEKARRRLAKFDAQTRNMRRAHVHNFTAKMTDEYTHIAVETLRVKNMVKNRHLSRSISDCGFYEIARQLEYKSQWKGGVLVKADPFYPSTKTCSKCGVVRDSISLSERTFVCEACGFTCDRDVNAARNLDKLNVV